jgi:glucokinase
LAKEAVARTSGSVLTGVTEFSADEVFNAADKGDAAALESFGIMGRYLGIGLAGIINVFNPQMIVIGGGASAGWSLFIEHVQNEVTLRAFDVPAEAVKIVRSELGDLAGILGAASVAGEIAGRRSVADQSLS